MNLNEAKIIITGASSGIGYETAKLLKEKGAQVVMSSKNPERLAQSASSLDLPYFITDVAKEQEVIDLFAFAMEEMGNVNVLINNAGFGNFAPLTETSVADFTAQWEVNTKGLFMAGREAAKHFVKEKYGNIINIGSTAALGGFPSGSAYVASKFAVSGLTQCWRAELRPHNVRVMQVNPSEVVTDFISKAGLESKDAEHKIKPTEIAHLIYSMLAMNDIGFIPDASVWSTNPWGK